ncbi:hypothetical protein [Thioclava sp. GXIMD4216]|uniref:hypothetical protein n=1 Tax=Thioclava sp. GXIMD4216 TaxID=3131929 RepID=UPI0030CE5045
MREIYRFDHLWDGIVENGPEGLVYELPVASGHVDKIFRFAISEAAFARMKADPERRIFLQAFLHSLYQMRPVTQQVTVDHHIDLILSGDPARVEEVLNRQEALDCGAVSNMVRILTGRDPAPMRQGTWFAQGRGTARPCSSGG